MAIGILIIATIALVKFKPVYTVYLDEEQIGCVQNKREFENSIEQKLYNNAEENIAFSDLNADVKYKLSFVNKSTETSEEETLQIVKENADKTYFQYAINLNGETKKYVKTEEEANKVIEELGDKGKNNNVTIETVYLKNLEIEKNVEVADIVSDISKEIKKQEKIEASTINGVYISVKPVSGRITSRYGAVESIRDHTHQGLDIAAQTGTPIKAVAKGKVSFSGTKNGYGNMIIINHGNGIQTYYGHCSKLYVEEGDTVKPGDVIAAVGSTGHSTGPHLHFEIRRHGEYVNPQKYLYN